MITVVATREGLPGGRTSTGWRIDPIVPFVALPSDAALRLWVLVTNPLNGRTCRALVLDVGPHYEHDTPYVFQPLTIEPMLATPENEVRPRAEQRGLDDYRRIVTNAAGIDLGEAVWAALGMKDNTKVGWSFV